MEDEKSQCKFCTGNVDYRDIMVRGEYSFVYIDGNRNLTLQDNYGWAEDCKIYFCPICGRKLHQEERK